MGAWGAAPSDAAGTPAWAVPMVTETGLEPANLLRVEQALYQLSYSVMMVLRRGIEPLLSE